MIEGLINRNGEHVPIASVLQDASEAGRKHPDKWSTYVEWLRMVYGICDLAGLGVDQDASRIVLQIKKAFGVRDIVVTV